MPGTLLSPREARDRRFPLPTGMLFVLLVIFGREVPVAVDPWEIEAT
jgi:hypothetical protein